MYFNYEIIILLTERILTIERILSESCFLKAKCDKNFNFRI